MPADDDDDDLDFLNYMAQRAFRVSNLFGARGPTRGPTRSGDPFTDDGLFGHPQRPNRNPRQRAAYDRAMEEQARRNEETDRLRKLAKTRAADEQKVAEAAVKNAELEEKKRLAKLDEAQAKVSEVEIKKTGEDAKLEQQELDWEEAGAVTEAAKKSICRHTDFWPKEVQKKKTKCELCHQKRGLVAFKCPFCSKLVCQVCVAKHS